MGTSWKRSLFSFFSTIIVSLFLLLYIGPSRDAGPNPHTPVAEPSVHGNAVAHLTERAAISYEAAREKGAKLHCLMAMSQEDANQATPEDKRPLEAPEYLQFYFLEEQEGWLSKTPSEVEPLFKQYLDSAFQGLGITKKLHNEEWLHVQGKKIYEDPFDDEGEFTPGLVTEAHFGNSFIVDAGVIIGDDNLSVRAALHTDLDLPNSVTHIRQWSDAAWMQWTKACQWADPAGDPANVHYIFRSWVKNHDTLRLAFQAVLNKHQKDGKGTNIGRWRDRITFTVEDNPDELYAILGSPNGSGSAFFLITHKGALGKKTINKVDVFVPNVPYTVRGTTITFTEEVAKIMFLFHVTDVD